MGFSQKAESKIIRQAADASYGFPPVSRHDAKLLILGTLPGAISLREQQYYAHPQNAFWKIMGELIGAPRELSYPERLCKLNEHKIALWDVCAAAKREGSLDSAIESETIQPNDFAAFFAAHPAIRCIAFNGAKASELYARCVLPTLPATTQLIARETMISTSPARTLPFAQKLAMWRGVLYTALGD